MTQKVKKLRYILYARKSSESEDRQVLSIDSQVDELKRIALNEGIEIANVLVESRSAKTLGRPVFAELIERLVAGKADGILCWKLDRLARNFIDGGKIIEMVQHGAIQHIRTFERNYYPADNVLLMSVEFGMANQYSRDLSVNVERGMRRKAEMGWYPVMPPLGYLNSKTKGRGKNDIQEDAERFMLVRRMWNTFLTGAYNVQRVWEMAAHEWGLTTRKGHKIARSTAYQIFTNPFYYGSYEWPKRSGNYYQGAHKPMISVEEYDRAQILLGRKGRPRYKTQEFAFTGVMKCANCGAAITAEEKHKLLRAGDIAHYIYYHCTKRKDPHCKEKSLTETKLTEQMGKKLLALKIPDEFHTWAMKWFESEQEREVESRGAILATQRKAYDDILKRLDRYMEMRAREEITETEYREKRGELLKEKARYMALLNDTDHNATKWYTNMDNAFKFVKRAEEKFKTGTLEERREIFLSLGSNFLLKYREVLLDMDDTLLPMQKMAAEVQAVHHRLEPTKKDYAQRDLEHVYSKNPKLCAGLDSNQRSRDDNAFTAHPV